MLSTKPGLRTFRVQPVRICCCMLLLRQPMNHASKSLEECCGLGMPCPPLAKLNKLNLNFWPNKLILHKLA
jgi:hypothetical protein